MTGPNVVLLSHQTANLWLFRRALMEALVARGCRVTAMAPPGEHADRFREIGVAYEPYALRRQGLNPWRELSVAVGLSRRFRRLKPDLVHCFTIKPNVYGTLAARSAGVKAVVCSVTGLGSLFIDGAADRPAADRPDGPGEPPLAGATPGLGVAREFLLRGLAAGLLGLAGRLASVSVFQNRDDQAYFTERRLLDPARTALVRGSGVDLERFSPQAAPDEAAQALRRKLGVPAGAVVIGMAARLIRDKGVVEFVQAARELRRRHGPRAICVLAGDWDAGNLRAAPRCLLDEAWREGAVILAGQLADMPRFHAMCDIVTLPSYREGLPVSLQEALAMGRPVVATDVPGCRETVEPEVNGLLVPVRDGRALAEALDRLVRDPAARRRMGEAGRAKAEREFDQRVLARQFLDLYGRFVALPSAGPGETT